MSQNNLISGPASSSWWDQISSEGPHQSDSSVIQKSQLMSPKLLQEIEQESCQLDTTLVHSSFDWDEEGNSGSR